MQDIDSFIEEVRREKLSLNDTDPIMMQDLKKASASKVLTKYCEAMGFSKDDAILNVFIRYINGFLDSVSNVHIFRCREKVQPSRWYYQANEADILPKPVKFTPKFGPEEILNKDSQGHVILRKLIRQYGADSIADQYGIDRYKLKNTIYRRRRVTDGKQMFKALPSYHFVRALRDVIHPDYWYIFPEELK